MPDDFLEYDEPGHSYFVNGVQVPSVTTILSASGFGGNFAFDEAAAHRGRLVHAHTADDDFGLCDFRKVPKHIRPYLHAWRGWRAISEFRPRLIEARVDCMTRNYAGRLDRVGHRGTRIIPTIVDIKTNKTGAVADYVKYQLVAYAYALDPTTQCERIAVVLKPDGTFNCKIWPLDQYRADLQTWLGMVDAYHSAVSA